MIKKLLGLAVAAMLAFAMPAMASPPSTGYAHEMQIGFDSTTHQVGPVADIAIHRHDGGCDHVLAIATEKAGYSLSPSVTGSACSGTVTGASSKSRPAERSKGVALSSRSSIST